MQLLRLLVTTCSLWCVAACSSRQEAPVDLHMEPHDLGPRDVSSRDIAPRDVRDHDVGQDRGGDVNVTTRYLTQLASRGDLATLQGRMNHVKYLAQVRGATIRPPLTETCYFQNMTLYEWHVVFLHSFEELADLSYQDYIALVLRQTTRVWWGGGVQLVKIPHPLTGAAESMAYTVYAETDGNTGLTEQEILEVDATLKTCLPFAKDQLAFYPSDSFQVTMAERSRASLAQQGVAVILP